MLHLPQITVITYIKCFTYCRFATLSLVDSGLLKNVLIVLPLSVVRREVAMSPADDGSDEPFTIVAVSLFLWSVGFSLVLCKKCYFRLDSVFLTVPSEGLTV